MELQPKATWALMSISEQVHSAELMRQATLKASEEGRSRPLHNLAVAFGSIRFDENKRFVAQLIERDVMAFDDEAAFWL